MYTDVYGNVCLTIPSGTHTVLSGLGDHETLVHTLIISPPGRVRSYVDRRRRRNREFIVP